MCLGTGRGFFSILSMVAFQASGLFLEKVIMVRNPFHLVEFSPWPLVGSVGAFLLTLGLASWFHGYSVFVLFVGLLIIAFTMFQWWRDIIREGTYQGFHTMFVVSGLRWGMILFITSEVLFFFAFFWAYFHSSLAPSLELGSC